MLGRLHEVFLDFINNSLGLFRIGFREEDGQFIAAQPGNYITGTNVFLNRFRNRL